LKSETKLDVTSARPSFFRREINGVVEIERDGRSVFQAIGFFGAAITSLRSFARRTRSSKVFGKPGFVLCFQIVGDLRLDSLDR